MTMVRPIDPPVDMPLSYDGLAADGVTLITPTGDRPEVFRLCERWMSRQTYDGLRQWIVVDDGITPTKVTCGQHHVRRERRQDDPAHTLPVNLLTALKRIRHERVLIIEDDDWYRPDYIERMLKRLSRDGLAGESHAICYRLDLGMWKTFQNRTWASLAATGLRGEAALRTLADACMHSTEIDLTLWRRYGKRKYVHERHKDCPLIVQFKRMPGRMGLGPQHACTHGYKPDEEARLLRHWLGDDVAWHGPCRANHIQGVC